MSLQLGDGATRGSLSRRTWRILHDSVGGRCASLNLMESSGQKTSSGEQTPLLQLMEWAQERRNEQSSGIMGLGYDEDDEEAREFFNNLSPSMASDEQYVRLHLGR